MAGEFDVGGDPQRLSLTVAGLTQYGDLLLEAGNGLRKIDVASGWSGPAATAFHQAYSVQPAQWQKAGGAFHDAAAAVDGYLAMLNWAREQAAAALRLHESGTPADQQQALADMAYVRGQLGSAGDTAARAVSKAASAAPPAPSFWSKFGWLIDGIGGILAVEGGLASGTLQLVQAATAAGKALADAQVSAEIEELLTGEVGADAGAAVADAGAATIGAEVAEAGALLAAGPVGAAVVLVGGIAMSAYFMSQPSQPAGAPPVTYTPPAPATAQDIADRASQLGFGRSVPAQQVPFDAGGQPVYTDGSDYITQDGNGWKLLDNDGNVLGSYDWNLTFARH